MNRTAFSFLILITVLLLVPQMYSQSIPKSIVLQGVLRDHQNNAVTDGLYNLKFSFYTQKSGGSAVWESPAIEVRVQNGSFQAKISDFESALNFDNQYYVGVTVQGDSEFAERIMLSAVPYTLRLLGTENVLSGTGNVGIGTTTPEEKLTVAGNIKVSGSIDLGTGLLINSPLRFNEPGGGIYNEFYRPIVLSSTSPSAGNKLQFFTGAANSIPMLEVGSSDGVVIYPEISLRLSTSQLYRGLRFGSMLSGAYSDTSYFISRGASTALKDHIVFHIDSSAGSKFNVTKAGGEVLLSAAGGSGNMSVGKEPDADAKLDVNGPIYIKGSKMFELREYSYTGNRVVETGYDASLWTAMIAGRKHTNILLDDFTAKWQLYVFEQNGTLKFTSNQPVTNTSSNASRVSILFIKKELVAGSNISE